MLQEQKKRGVDVQVAECAKLFAKSIQGLQIVH